MVNNSPKSQHTRKNQFSPLAWPSFAHWIACGNAQTANNMLPIQPIVSIVYTPVIKGAYAPLVSGLEPREYKHPEFENGHKLLLDTVHCPHRIQHRPIETDAN